MVKNNFTALALAGLIVAAPGLAGCGQRADTGNVNVSPADANMTTGGGNLSGAAMPASVDNSHVQPSPEASAPAANSAGATNRPVTARDSKMPQPQVGSGGNDFYLFTQARGALNADDELKNTTITIDVREGVATLTGTVANDGQRQKAARLVKGVQGIKAVNDRLSVAAGGSK